MTAQGVLLVCFAALAVAALVFHQLLRRRLYVGYAVAWLLVISGVVCLVAIPALTRLVSVMTEAVFPSSSLTIVSLGFVTLVLVYFSIQLSILSDRVTRIAQSLAIANLEKSCARELEGR